MNTTSHKKVVLAFLLGLIIITTPPVNADVVSNQWKNNIEGHLQQVDANTTAEIVIFVVQSLRGHGIKKEGSEINEITKLGVHIFNELPLDTPNGPVIGIGKKGKDNGVLVLVAIEEREWRIEIGYGLEGYITDIETNQIAQQRLIPKFRQGKYGEGLYDTVVALSQKIPTPPESEDLPIRGRYFYENLSVNGTPLWIIVLVSIILAAVILAIIIIVYLVKKGKIKVKKTRSTRGGYQSGGSSRTPSNGRKGGGGRSGGGGAKGKW